MRASLVSLTVMYVVLATTVATAGGQGVPVAFEVARVCACDCVNQYRVDVRMDETTRPRCQGLNDDGDWVEVWQRQYSPDPGMVIYTQERYTAFVCETPDDES